MSAQGLASRRAPGSTQDQSLSHRAVKVITTIVLAVVFALAAVPAAIAGPGCDTPGVCPPGFVAR